MQIRRVLLLLLFSLAGCSYYQDPTQLEGDIISPGNFKAGSGVIASVGVLPNAAQSAASGASKRRDPHLYRLYLRMDGGGFQSVDVDNGSFFPGAAVELTNDGRVVRVTGTSLSKTIGQR
ncbi:MAG TPA: hypothetical protein VET51_04105 [Burkholderiales bacterium]|nr:hypothetical protein [Burkholderiales bacterium]